WRRSIWRSCAGGPSAGCCAGCSGGARGGQSMDDETGGSVGSGRIPHPGALFSGLGPGLVGRPGPFLAPHRLVIKRGPRVGPHLALLGQFLPGYEVTFLGSVIGLAYGFVVGFVAGYGVSALYNHLARGQNPSVASAGLPTPAPSSESRQT